LRKYLFQVSPLSPSNMLENIHKYNFRIPNGMKMTTLISRKLSVYFEPKYDIPPNDITHLRINEFDEKNFSYNFPLTLISLNIYDNHFNQPIPNLPHLKILVINLTNQLINSHQHSP
jgi:hypothetical protein